MYPQNEINNDIKFLAKSEIRLKILNEIYKKPNNVRGIVKKTKITYSSVSSNIGKLEKNNHITKIVLARCQGGDSGELLNAAKANG